MNAARPPLPECHLAANRVPPSLDRASLLIALGGIVGHAAVLSGGEAAPYERGARYGNGRALCVVLPQSVDQVSRVVACCATAGVRVVAQGSNTGLVGASSPDGSGTQVLVSLKRLRTRFDLDVLNRTVEADAGFLLSDMDERLAFHGLWLPIDIGADASVGGMIASNTGGTRLMRFGDVRHNLLAVEAVLFDPPGAVARFGSALRKDNTGFDLKQLFTGTSGAAGIITSATLEVSYRPTQTATALIVPTSEDRVIPLLLAAEAQLGDFLCAFEGMSANSIHAALDHVPSVRSPFGPNPIPEFTILLELASRRSQTDLDLESLLNRFLEDRLNLEEIENAVIGRGNDLWRLRHALSEGTRALGQVIGFDISVRRGDLMRFRAVARAMVAARYPYLTIVDFGHIGDGGLHFNVVSPLQNEYAVSDEVIDQLRSDVYELVVQQFGGSFSAEHGIGPHNIRFYSQFTPDSVRRLAGKVQRVFDPQGLGGTVSFGMPHAEVFHT